jgi:3-oxo-4,17-pregnadiene-20-carboxyl-CoA hydratase alpha subunit
VRAVSGEDLLERLRAIAGARSGEPVVARDPVNLPMIRHWCDAIDDRNPVYTDPELAARSLHRGIVAPPTMLQAWTMPGLVPKEVREARMSSRVYAALRLLDEAGFTSVVATNCTQEYQRYLRPGDLLSAETAIEDVSEEKKTALGAGHFVTQRTQYRDQNGELVASLRFRLLKFRPAARAGATPPAPARPRPKPALTHDNRFFWEGVAQRELRIQRCNACHRLQHPPGPMCAGCHGLDLGFLRSRGRGTVYSFVYAHHPAIPAFEVPNLIVLVELEEGTRIVSNLVGAAREQVRIGMPVAVEFAEVEPGRLLPRFRPTAG